MTTKLEQAARQLLDYWDLEDSGSTADVYMNALREALAEQAEQEPVGYFAYDEEHDIWEELVSSSVAGGVPLYREPVQPVKQEPVAKAIHYPECWDTAAYPTLESALAELFAWFKCSNDDCAALVQQVDPIPFGKPGSREGFPGLDTLETLAHPLKECRHCGWLCTPNAKQSKKFYPLAQQPFNQPVIDALIEAFGIVMASESRDQALNEIEKLATSIRTGIHKEKNK